LFFPCFALKQGVNKRFFKKYLRIERHELITPNNFRFIKEKVSKQQSAAKKCGESQKVRRKSVYLHRKSNEFVLNPMQNKIFTHETLSINST